MVEIVPRLHALQHRPPRELHDHPPTPSPAGDRTACALGFDEQQRARLRGILGADGDAKEFVRPSRRKSYDPHRRNRVSEQRMSSGGSNAVGQIIRTADGGDEVPLDGDGDADTGAGDADATSSSARLDTCRVTDDVPATAAAVTRACAQAISGGGGKYRDRAVLRERMSAKAGSKLSKAQRTDVLIVVDDGDPAAHGGDGAMSLSACFCWSPASLLFGVGGAVSGGDDGGGTGGGGAADGPSAFSGTAEQQPRLRGRGEGGGARSSDGEVDADGIGDHGDVGKVT